MVGIEDVPLIVRREIEARMLAPFYEAFVSELGQERTDCIVERVVAGMAEQAGRDLAAEKPEGMGVLEYYEQVVTPRFSANDAMAWESIRSSADELSMDAVRCAFADMYRRLGLEHLGELLSCRRDPHLFRGLDENIEFSRTETIMQGCDRCDFRLRVGSHEGNVEQGSCSDGR